VSTTRRRVELSCVAINGPLKDHAKHTMRSCASVLMAYVAET